MAKKPSIPKGTRDFSPSEVTKRNYIFDTVKRHFEVFGFQPIETPSFENSDTLMGKYGDEGDRLIFKILESGDFYEKFVASHAENAISIYVSITYIFHDVTKKILEVLKKNEEYELPADRLEKIVDSDDFSGFYKYKVEEWSYFLLEKPEYRMEFENILLSKRDNFFNTCINFILISGLDFKINDVEYIESRLKWANREYIKDFASSISYLIENKIPEFHSLSTGFLASKISEKALRYDLTVPFARYVVMHQNEIDFPFKRYQIQPVWRADRPQKGRFREFYQCDADVVGSDSLFQEIELIQLYDAVFSDLKLEGVTIKLNNRKILAGIAEVIGAKHLLVDFTVALDKLDKIGEEGVRNEMLRKGISEESIEKLTPLFHLTGGSLVQLESLKLLLSDSQEGIKGIEELIFVVQNVQKLGLKASKLSVDVTLARGLNYYTGAILEVVAPEGVDMGSIGGGGRYDDLTGIFGMKDMSGVGISFGLDRIYLVLEELNLFPEAIEQSIQVLCVNFGEEEALVALQLVTYLRKSGVKADLYPSSVKMRKQMKYANNRNVPYVVSIGAQELAEGSFVVKDMIIGSQKTYQLSKPKEFLESL